MKKREWAYLAGLIDGEGCITSHRNGDACHAWIKITNANRDMMDWVLGSFGGVLAKKPPRKEGYKALYIWRVHTAAHVDLILKGVLPYLTAKTGQANLAIELCKRPHKTRQLEIHKELQLAKRG